MRSSSPATAEPIGCVDAPRRAVPHGPLATNVCGVGCFGHDESSRPERSSCLALCLPSCSAPFQLDPPLSLASLASYAGSIRLLDKLRLNVTRPSPTGPAIATLTFKSFNNRLRGPPLAVGLFSLLPPSPSRILPPHPCAAKLSRSEPLARLTTGARVGPSSERRARRNRPPRTCLDPAPDALPRRRNRAQRRSGPSRRRMCLLLLRRRSKGRPQNRRR